MENASKALLIAGGVLIAIILIAMGVRILNSTSGTTDSVETTSQALENAMYNKKFNMYIGERKSAKTVKQLAEVIISHNGVAKNDDEKIRFKLYEKYNHTYCDSSNQNNILDAVTKIPDDRLYKIQIFETGENGLIKTIYVWIPDHY